MLYKKIHRQYLKNFRLGRKFKFCGLPEVYEITREPRIGLCYISTDRWLLIELYSGKMTLHDGYITWID